MKRMGCLIIGDEILGGHVTELNSQWLAKRCKQLGVEMRRVEICTDDVEDIEATTRRFLHDLDLDYVVTSGGLGPTPDDRTMEGIARALGVEVVMEPEWRDWMRERVAFGHKLGYFKTAEPNAGMWKMAKLPKGATAMPNHLGTCLGAIVEVDGTTLFTLPGVPKEFQRMFDESVEPMLERSEAHHVAELELYTEESRFYETLVDLETRFPGVAIGSYPHWGSITIRATGPKADAEAAIDVMRRVGADYLEKRPRPTDSDRIN